MIGNITTGLYGVGFTPFSPSSIAGLKGWYDASDTASISLSGSNVTQWNDKSGNGYHVTQGTAARRPVSGTTTLNSKNVIVFDGNDVLQAATASDWKFMNDATGSTTFLVFRVTTGANPVILDTAGSTTGNTGISFFRAGAGLFGWQTVRSVGGTYVAEYNNQTLNTGTTYYFSNKSDPANATASQRLIFKVNGGANNTPNTRTAALNNANPFQPLFIGSYDTAGSDGLNGYIAELIVYSGLLSDTDIGTLNSYLASKWGL
jgi:hypothetical protein